MFELIALISSVLSIIIAVSQLYIWAKAFFRKKRNKKLDEKKL